jgi:hypothetical protein
MAMVLVAVLTMPVCLNAANAPLLDGDLRTVTESRNITETMHDPGVHLLHQHLDDDDACAVCAPDQGWPGHEFHLTPDDLAQRVAVLPLSPVVHADVPELPLVLATPVDLAVALSPPAPPPRNFSQIQ